MAKTKKEKGVLVLDKNKLDLFVPSMSAVVSFPFQPAVVRNIELIDKNLLQSQLHTFFQTNKIIPADFILILHENILFEKQFPSLKPTASKQPAAVPVSSAPQASTLQQTPTQPVTKPQPQPGPSQPGGSGAASGSAPQGGVPSVEEQEKTIQHFIDTIPFEDVSAKKIKVNDGTLVVGTNKALLQALKDCFATEGSSIEAAYPVTVFGKTVDLASGLTPAVAQVLLAKSDTVKAQNMLEEPKPLPVSPLAAPLALPQKESEKKRLIILGSVFGVLIIIMIVMFMRMNEENAKRQKPQPAASPAAAVANPTATPPIASESAILRDSVAIRITGNTTDVQQLQRTLSTEGFTDITVGQGTVTVSQPLVIFSPGVPSTLRELITGSVASVSAQFTVQESSASAEPTVVITL